VGNVDFLVDGTPQSTNVTLSGGQATFTTNSLTAGSHSITVNFLGSDNFAASTGTLIGGQTVNKAATSTAIHTTNNNAFYGEAIITATVTSPGGTPDGTVTFTVTPFGGSATTVTVGLNASGVATLSPTLDAGVYSIVATYNASASFNGS